MNACAASGASKPEAARAGAEVALREALRRALREHPAARVWIGFSGGRDSSALLRLSVEALAGLPQSARPALGAIHIDHGLHPRSADWAAHCRDQCAALGVALRVSSLMIVRRRGKSLEETARDARWSVWEAMLAVGEQLWLAQHRDDQAETLLLALLRGAGVKGLAAMPRVRALGAGLVVRPWRDCPAAWIADYAESRALRWVEDPSNQDMAFDRNYLRQRILPAVRERWPAATRTIARSAGHCAEAATLLDALSADWLAAARGSLPASLSVSALRLLPPDRCRALLRRWCAERGFRVPDQRRLEQISRDLLFARADAQPLVAWPGCEARRYRDALFLIPPLPPPPTGFDQIWDPLGPLRLDGRLGELSLPVAPLVSPLRVVFSQPGLRCQPRPGGPSRALKAIFQQHGVPAWLRPYVPLVLCGDQLLGIAGVALCDSRLPALRWYQCLGEGLGLSEQLGGATGC